MQGHLSCIRPKLPAASLNLHYVSQWTFTKPQSEFLASVGWIHLSLSYKGGHTVVFSMQHSIVSQFEHDNCEFDQHLDLLNDFQADLHLLDLASQSRGGAVGSSPHDEALVQQHAPEPRRVVSNRKAQQRFRQRQKARKASEASELLYLRGRVQELEQMVSTGLDHDSPPASQPLAQVQQLLASELCTSCCCYCLPYKSLSDESVNLHRSMPAAPMVCWRLLECCVWRKLYSR